MRPAAFVLSLALPGGRAKKIASISSNGNERRIHNKLKLINLDRSIVSIRLFFLAHFPSIFGSSKLNNFHVLLLRLMISMLLFYFSMACEKINDRLGENERECLDVCTLIILHIVTIIIVNFSPSNLAVGLLASLQQLAARCKHSGLAKKIIITSDTL